MTPEQLALHQIRAFFHNLPLLTPEARTAAILSVLTRCPLEVAVGRAGEAGGLRNEDWWPMACQAKDLVMREHAPREWLKLPTTDNPFVYDNGSRLLMTGRSLGPAYESQLRASSDTAG